MRQQNRPGGDPGGVPWWRGFRAVQGPSAPVGIFPSSLVVPLNPAQARAPVSASQCKAHHPTVNDLVVSRVPYSLLFTVSQRSV